MHERQRPAWSSLQIIPGQPGLHRENLSQKKKNQHMKISGVMVVFYVLVEIQSTHMHNISPFDTFRICVFHHTGNLPQKRRIVNIEHG